MPVFRGGEGMQDMPESTKKSLERLKIMREGGTIPCPLCGKGEWRMINPAVFTCDHCGKGIVGLVPLED